MFKNYSEFSYVELRELLLNGELEHEYMTEEDYSEIIENELELPEPSMEVLDLCVEGLNQYDDYKALDNNKVDITSLINETIGKKKIRIKRLIKTTLIAAAVVIVALLAQVVSVAFGFDLFGYIFNWNKEKVYITTISNDNDLSVDDTDLFIYENIESIPDELMIYISPFIIENYIFTEALYIKDGESFHFNIRFVKNNDINLSLIITKSINKTVEKDNDYFEEYEKDGVIYSIFKNLDYNRALWIKDGILYDLNINLSLDEVKEIIDNFY